jgi:hypothetical protein
MAPPADVARASTALRQILLPGHVAKILRLVVSPVMVAVSDLHSRRARPMPSGGDQPVNEAMLVVVEHHTDVPGRIWSRCQDAGNELEPASAGRRAAFEAADPPEIRNLIVGVVRDSAPSLFKMCHNW